MVPIAGAITPAQAYKDKKEEKVLWPYRPESWETTVVPLPDAYHQ